MSDKKETSSPSQAQLVETLAEYRSLARSAAWGRLVKVWEEQVTLRGNEILCRDDEGLDDLIRTNGLRGERKGLKLAMGLLPSIIEQIEYDLEEMRDEPEE